MPDAPYVHVFVGRGVGDAGGCRARSSDGDAARLTGAGSPTLTAGADGAEVLVWEMTAA